MCATETTPYRFATDSGRCISSVPVTPALRLLLAGTARGLGAASTGCDVRGELGLSAV